MARQRIQMTAGELIGAVLIGIVIIGIGFFPRVLQAAPAKATLQDSLRCMQQNPGCTPTPKPSPGE